MKDAPPQIIRSAIRREVALLRNETKAQPVALDPATLSHLTPDTIRRNADNLPVLAAFQQYLELERRRTRQRMLTLTGIFLAILILAAGAGLFAGFTYYRAARDQISALQQDLVRVQQTTDETLPDAIGTLSKLEARTSGIEDSLDRRLQAMQSDRTRVAHVLAAVNTNMTTVSSLLARLQTDNAALHRALEARDDNWSAISNRVVQLLGATTPMPAGPSPTVRPDGPRITPRRGERLVMAIIPEGQSRATDWRLPLPDFNPE